MALAKALVETTWQLCSPSAQFCSLLFLSTGAHFKCPAGQCPSQSLLSAEPTSKDTYTESPINHHHLRRPASHWEERWMHCSLSSQNGQPFHLTHIPSMGTPFLAFKSGPSSKNLQCVRFTSIRFPHNIMVDQEFPP